MARVYDVIIIGSGAGGGTLARHLAPSGKSILILERGGWLPRELENWDAEEVFIKNRYVPKGDLVRQQRQAVSAGRALLGRRRDQAVRRRAVPPAQRGLRRAAPLRRRLAGLADQLRRARAVLHQGRADVSGARRPRRGLDRAAVQRTVSVPGRFTRATHPAAARRSRSGPATIRSTPRAALCSTNSSRSSAPAFAARPATASPASSTPSRMPKCMACVPRCSIPTLRC